MPRSKAIAVALRSPIDHPTLTLDRGVPPALSEVKARQSDGSRGLFLQLQLQVLLLELNSPHFKLIENL